MKEKIFLVSGATGKQGGATARHLLKSGVKVRALTRKPEGKRAQALHAAGIEVVKGDFNDPTSLDAALQGIHGVFSVQNFWEFGTGKKETTQCQNLTDAAKRQGVEHLVFASIARCDDNPNLAHFVTKYENEKYIQQSGVPFTFLRAVYFMDNLQPKADGVSFHWSIMEKTLGENGTMQMIACEDIGWFVAKALLNPGEWIGKTLDIAGDNVTYTQMLAAYQKSFGTTPLRSPLSKFLIPLLLPEIRKMFNWYREPRFHADIESLQKIHPGLMSLEDFFKSSLDV